MTQEKSTKNHDKTTDRLFTLDDIIKSIQNTQSNINHYKKMKEHCKKCSFKFNDYVCFEKRHCEYYIPSMIHLDVMKKKLKELWEEYKGVLWEEYNTVV